MLTDATVVLGLPGPHSSTDRAVAATTNPVTNQRMTWGRGDDLGAGLARRPLHDPGVGDVDDEPDHHGDDHEELAEQQLEREQGDAAVDVEDGGVHHQLQHRGQDGQLQLDVGGDPPVDVAAQVDGLDQGGEVVVGEHDLGGLLGDF